MPDPFEPFPEVMALGHERLQEICKQWCQTPQAQECGVAFVNISPDCRRFDPGLMLSGAWGYGKSTEVHFPFDRLMHYIVDHGCQEEHRAILKDRLQKIRLRVGPNVFQRFRLTIEAVLMSVRCHVCQMLLVSNVRLFADQTRDYPWTGNEETTCPKCGVDVPINPRNVLWVIDPEQTREL